MTRDMVIEPYLAEVGRVSYQAPPEDLIGSHLLLAVKLAGRYRGRGVDYADLVGEANLALVEAAKDWPRSKAKRRGLPFNLYAQRVIRHRLLEAIIKANPFSMSVHTWLKIKGYEQAQANLRDQIDQNMAAEQNLDMPAEQVRQLRHLAYRIESVVHWEDVMDPEKGATYAEMVADPFQDIEDKVLTTMEREETRRELAKAIDNLPSAARLAVSLRFGIKPPSLDTVSFDEVIRVSQSTHNVDNGLRRLRKRVRADGKTVVSEDRKPFVSFAYSPLRPGSEARIRRDADEWRRLAGELQEAGVLTSPGERAGAVCAGE